MCFKVSIVRPSSSPIILQPNSDGVWKLHPHSPNTGLFKVTFPINSTRMVLTREGCLISQVVILERDGAIREHKSESFFLLEIIDGQLKASKGVARLLWPSEAHVEIETSDLTEAEWERLMEMERPRKALAALQAKIPAPPEPATVAVPTPPTTLRKKVTTKTWEGRKKRPVMRAHVVH